ncbi:MAG: TIGR03936 family radical SAM-associated protein [Bacillota bacterium]
MRRLPRYRVKFSKDGPARYSSHLDMVRFFDRSTRRAGLPVAFSEGFNPHPKFSFAAPLPVGVAGLEEYMDMELKEYLEPAEIARRLESNLPEGYKILDVKEVVDRAPALMSRIARAAYRATATLPAGYSEVELNTAIDHLMDQEEIMITREVKGKRKEVDIRPGIFRLAGGVKGHILEINMELLIGSTGNVRPEEVLLRLSGDGGVPVDPEDFRIRRTALFAEGDTGPISLWEV